MTVVLIDTSNRTLCSHLAEGPAKGMMWKLRRSCSTLEQVAFLGADHVTEQTSGPKELPQGDKQENSCAWRGPSQVGVETSVEQWSHTQHSTTSYSAGTGPWLVGTAVADQSHQVAQTGWLLQGLKRWHCGPGNCSEKIHLEWHWPILGIVDKVRLNETAHFILAALQDEGPWLGVRHSRQDLVSASSKMGLISRVLMIK